MLSTHACMLSAFVDVKHTVECLLAWLLSLLAVLLPRCGTQATLPPSPSRSARTREPDSAETWQQLGYSYNGTLDALRQQQFPQLGGTTYLDHAATTLCSARQLDAAHAELRSQLFVNPHSQQQHLSVTRQAEEELRMLTLAMLHADPQQYEVVFTSGATAAMKLAGECFPWTSGPHSSSSNHHPASSSTAINTSSSSSRSSSVCYYPVSSHNSLLGVVQQAAAAGARLAPFQLQPDGACTLLPPPDPGFPSTSSTSSSSQVGTECQQQEEEGENEGEGLQAALGDAAVTHHHLVLLPAECNFSGQRLSAAQVTGILQQLQQQAAAAAAAAVGATVSCSSKSSAALGDCQEEEGSIDQQQQQQQAPAGSMGPAHAHAQQQQVQPADPQQQQQQQQQGGRVERWVLLLDAAKACTTHPPDLSTCPADLVALSYYKIFGHPTGLGALVVKRDLLPELTRRKVYFGGGTVEVSIPQQAWYIRRPGAAGLEDGTFPFTAIAAARHGFRELQHLGGFSAIDRHTACLTLHLALQLYCLRHSNGARVAELYCSPAGQQLLQQWEATCSNPINPDSSGNNSSSSRTGCRRALFVPTPGQLAAWRGVQGAVVTFNLCRPDGSWVGYGEVQQLAGAHDILLRTGCFCNPGACAAHLGISPSLMRAHHAAGHVCGDARDLIGGAPTGAVRASLGYMSSWGDVEALLALVGNYFVDEGVGSAAPLTAASGGTSVSPTVGGSTLRSGSAPGTISDTCTHSSSFGNGLQRACSGLQRACTTTTGTPPPGRGLAGGGSNRNSTAEPAAGAGAAALAPCCRRAPAGGLWVYSFAAALAAAARRCTQCTVYVLIAMCEGLSRVWQLAAGAPMTAASSTQVYSTMIHSNKTNISADVGQQQTGIAAVHTQQAAVAEQSDMNASEDSCTSMQPVAGHVSGQLSSIYLYPIKSCSAQQVLHWPIGPKGLLFDREWALVNPAGQLLTLKHCPRLTQLQPHVDLEARVLTVAVAGGVQPPLRLRIRSSSDAATAAAGDQSRQVQGDPVGVHGRHPQQLQVRVCGDTMCGSVLSEVLLPQLEGAAAAPTPAAVAAVAGAAGGVAGEDTKDSTCFVTPSWPSRFACSSSSSKPPAGKGVRASGPAAAADGGVAALGGRMPAAAAAASGLTAVEDWFEAAVGVRCRVVQAAAHARMAKVAPIRQEAGGPCSPAADVAGGREADQGSRWLGQEQHRNHQPQKEQEPKQQQQQQQQLGFANEGQYLLLNLSSLDALLAPHQQQQQQTQHQVQREDARPPNGATTAAVTGSTHQGVTRDSPSVLRFRPNLVVSGVPPWAEDSWSAVQIGAVQLQSAGACARCDLVTLHPGTGEREGQGVLRALAGSRRHNGKLHFGLLLSNAAGVGDASNSGLQQHLQVGQQGDSRWGTAAGLPWLYVGDAVLGRQ